MAVKEFTANNVINVVRQVVSFLTDSSVFGVGNAWTLVSPTTFDAITEQNSEVILKGVGDGYDEIYVGIKTQPGAAAGQTDIVLNGFAGYDANLGWREQPGAIPHAKLPTIPLVDVTKVTCWLLANTSRFILVVQMSTQYESAYVGFIKPVAVERQYPYPLVIGGSYIEGKTWNSNSPGHSTFLNPGSDSYGGLGNLQPVAGESLEEFTSSLRIRRADGVWRAGANRNSGNTALHFERLCVWPQNTEPTNVLTVLDNSLTIENVIMFPCILYETYPGNIVGQFDGIYFIGNREDLASKDVIIHDGKTYKVFNNVFRRDNDSYFVMEWF